MKTYTLLLMPLFLWSCGPSSQAQDISISEEESENINAIKLLSEDDGLAALRMNCYACHNPRSESHKSMLAPPLAGIKARYASLYPDREIFISRMASFIEHPDKSKSIMKGPVRRFGLMPATTLDRKEILEIVAFIYDHKLEMPDWFIEHYEKENRTKWKD